MAGRTPAQIRAEQTEAGLKQALWHSLGLTLDALSAESGINASPRFLGALSELVYDRIGTAAVDVEAFARHAERSVVNVKDVVLLGRHNDALKHILEEEGRRVRENA